MKRLHFGNLYEKFRRYQTSKFVVLPIPYEKTSSYIRGTKKGPKAVLEASANLELYDYEIDHNTAEEGIFTYPPIRGNTPERIIKRSKEIVNNTIKEGKIPITIGGEHTVALGPIIAAKKNFPELSILHLDAHLDLRNMFEGNRYSHACIMRRIREIVNSPTVHVGIRSLCEEEAKYVKKNERKDLIVFYDTKYDTDEIIKNLTKDVYITLDLDVLDPSVMPAVGTPEPGGLGWYDLLDIVKEVCTHKNIVGFDIVELTPIKGLDYPNYLTAKLIYKMMGYVSKFSVSKKL